MEKEKKKFKNLIKWAEMPLYVKVPVVYFWIMLALYILIALGAIIYAYW